LGIKLTNLLLRVSERKQVLFHSITDHALGSLNEQLLKAIDIIN